MQSEALWFQVFLKMKLWLRKWMFKMVSYFYNFLVFFRMKEIISVGKRQFL